MPSTVVEGICAQNWIRTSTSLRTLRPEHSASTNFAIWALIIQGCKYRDVLQITDGKYNFLFPGIISGAPFFPNQQYAGYYKTSAGKLQG